MDNRDTISSDPIIGLTVLLRKYGINKLPAKSGDGSSMVLGHYDKLFIEPMYRWLDFSPGNLWKKNESPTDKAGEPFALSSYYPIKLLFPGPTVESRWSEFAFSSWRNYERLLSTAPCISLALINLTDAYKQTVGNKSLLENFLALILKSEQVRPLLQPCSLCVMPCMGYSDFCLLMAGESWNYALKLVESLHDLSSPKEGHEDGIPVLSTDYMIPAFRGQNSTFALEHLRNLRLMIKVNLSPGVTAHTLADHVPQDVKVFRCSGGSDCLLQAENAEANCALMEALIGSGNSTGLVIDMTSSLNLPVEPLTLPKNIPSQEETQEIFVDVIQEFNQAIFNYEQKLVEFHRHLRQANSLRELSASILNVGCRPHAAPLRSILKAFVRDFAWCLTICTKRMNIDDWDFNEMERHVSLLCSTITGFISDISRSDCFAMEHEKYIHSSVGSSTSLLVAYNHWLIELTKKVRTITQGDNGSEYTFLVTSGGCDHTNAMSAFYFLTPEVDEDGHLFEKLPIVTHMSETSLLDFSGTIMRCFHECLHFCGERYRSERLGYMRKCAVYLLAANISGALFPPETTVGYIEEVYKKLVPSASDEDILLHEADTLYWQIYSDLKCEVAHALDQCLNHCAQTNELSFLARNVEAFLHDSLMEAFSNFVIYDDTNEYHNRLTMSFFTRSLYSIAQRIFSRFYKEADALFARHVPDGLPETAFFDFEYNRQKLYCDADLQNGQKKLDTPLQLNIELILSRLLISEPPSNLDATNKNSKELKYWKQAFPHIDLCYTNLSYTLSVVTDVFTETFSDVMACKILGATLEDYLISQVFEDWDLNNSLPIDDPTIYRISAALKVLFPTYLSDDCLRLTAEARDDLNQAIERIEKHGSPFGHLEASDLCNRIDELLKNFSANPDAGVQLTDYLQLCLDRYAERKVWDKLSGFQDDFAKIRLLSIDPDAENYHAALMEMYGAFRERVHYD